MNKSRNILRDIGATLAAERERQGLTVSNVSQHLRIFEDHLIFIEKGNLDKLPAMTYVIGYVRSYARMLGLDATMFCADLKSSLIVTHDKPQFDFMEARLDKKTGAGRVALVAVVAGIFIYGGWYSISVTSTPSSNVDVAAVISPDETAVSPSSDASEIAPGVAPGVTAGATLEPEQVEVVPDGEDSPLSDEQNIEDGADTAATVVTETTVNDSGDISSRAVEEASAVQPTGTVETDEDDIKVTDAFAVNRSPDAEIIIEAIANSWVEVSRADGTPVTSRLMRLGDTYLIPSDQDLFLTTGNAGGLNLRMGNEAPFTLGAWGEALRELPLDKAIISARY